MGVMPYRLEKGLFLMVLESWFNEGLEHVGDGATKEDIFELCEGPRRRLRAIWRYCSIAAKLRAAGEEGRESIREVTPENSLIESRIFRSPKAQVIPGLKGSIAEGWFGMKPAGDRWERPLVSDWKPDPDGRLPSLGRWSGYYGNTELILVETLQRMLEVSLGLDHQDTVPDDPTDRDTTAAYEARLRGLTTRVWPVYLFLTCPQPWFEAWVTWQCHRKSSLLRGQVTVTLSTPGHDRPVAPSPVDVLDDPKEVPKRPPGSGTVANPYYLHGLADEPYNTGYEGPYVDPGPPVELKGGDPKNTSLHERAGQGMWVITHPSHDSTIVWTTFHEPTVPNFGPGAPTPVEGWDLPPIAHYRCAPLGERPDVMALVHAAEPERQVTAGASTPAPLTISPEAYYNVVVVSPASRDGGIPTEPVGEGGGDDHEPI